MRVIGEAEFYHFLRSVNDYDKLVKKHRRILYDAYVDVSPVMTVNDTVQGSIRVKDVSVEKYVFKLLDLRKQLEDERKSHHVRISAYHKAYQTLEAADKEYIQRYMQHALEDYTYLSHEPFRRLRGALEKVSRVRK